MPTSFVGQSSSVLWFDSFTAHSRRRRATLPAVAAEVCECRQLLTISLGGPATDLNYRTGDGFQAIVPSGAFASDLPVIQVHQMSISGTGFGALEQIRIENQGTGAGQIGYEEGFVTYGGVTIGVAVESQDLAAGTRSIDVTLLPVADLVSIQALFRAVQFNHPDAIQTSAMRHVSFAVECSRLSTRVPSTSIPPRRSCCRTTARK